MATPMTAAELLAALKAEGVIVKTPHSGWTTHERDAATGKPFGPVHGVVMHHTAGHDVGSYVYNGSSDLPGPLCHGYIRKDGAVEMCSAGRANHAGGGDPDVLNAVKAESYMTRPPAPKYHEGSPGAADGNDPFYGFECENLGDGKDPWPRVQYVAMVKAATAVCRHYGWSEKSVIGHLEWSDWKSDPRGFSMVDFRADVKACLSMKPGRWAGTATVPQEDPMALTTEEHDWLKALYEQRRVAPWTYKNTTIDDRDMHQVVRDTETSVKALAVTGLTDAQIEAIAAKVADVLAARLDS